MQCNANIIIEQLQSTFHSFSQHRSFRDQAVLVGAERSGHTRRLGANRGQHWPTAKYWRLTGQDLKTKRNQSPASEFRDFT